MIDPQPLWTWANERHAVYVRKTLEENGQYYSDEWCPDPVEATADDGYLPYQQLTSDPIIQQYRFCNVFRELDRVTIWIKENIREPFKDHPDLWLMLAIARYINWPETLQFLIDSGYSWPGHEIFDPEGLGTALDYYKGQGKKVYTGAYMIRAESNPNAEWYSWTKQQYVARVVIGRLWEDREEWTKLLDGDTPPGRRPTIWDVWSRFQHSRYIGWGPFMAYQVCVDLRHTRYLRDALDINTWSALGPGSRRGLNRLAGRPVDYNLSQADGLKEMLEIYNSQDQYRAPWLPHVELSDIQNCLCETDKYLRVKQGEGKPRSKYVPGRGW